VATLITGGAGFVGLALAEHLLAEGGEVVLFDTRPPPEVFLRAMRSRPGRLHHRTGDVRDRGALKTAFTAAAVTRVFQGAAITADTTREAVASDLILDVNLTGTLRVLEAALEHKVERFLYPSSLVVYGASLYDRALAIEDETPAIPDTLYAITKYAGERLALRFGATRGLDVVCGRIGSVFGPWESDTGVRDSLSPFWQAAELARSGQEILLASAELPRQLIYVRDLAAALNCLLHSRRPSYPVYNLAVAADWASALRDWCALLASKQGATWRVADAGETPNVVYDLRARAVQDTRRLSGDLGFLPRFKPKAALADYAAWLTAANQR
jgi:nucleoside-diphosphate-sugar epimerase